MKQDPSPNPPPYKKWSCFMPPNKINQFKKNSSFDFVSLPFGLCLVKLNKYLEKKYPEENLPILKKLEVQIFYNDEYEENFIVDQDGNLYIRSFFFNTLTQKHYEEITGLVLFFYIKKQHLLEDLIIDLVTQEKQFLESRKKLFKDEEYHAIFDNLCHEERPLIWGIIFIAQIYFEDKVFDKITLLEAKNLKEIYFSKKMKKLLNLNEEDYNYIQKTHSWGSLDIEKQKKFLLIQQEIENNQINLQEYVERHLKNKKILFWCIWTISPFLAIDISQLFSIIHEYKNIKKVYLDLPTSSQGIINDYIYKQNFSYDTLETEVKKIYPDIIDDYVKETLPYLKLLDRLQLYKIPQNCIGFTGNELSKKLPRLEENQLVFDLDEKWNNAIYKEIKNLPHLQSDELVIFFYFLKPMHYLLPYNHQHKEVESLIHTDIFTGYGPNRAENNLSFYSQYHPMKQQLKSFVLPNLPNLSFKDQNIVFFPYKKEDFFRLNDDIFNKFHLFNSLLYSSNRGNGGNNHYSPFEPYNLDKKKIRV